MKFANCIGILVVFTIFHYQGTWSYSNQYRSSYVKDIGVTLRMLPGVTLIGCGFECNSHVECNGFRYNIPGDKYVTCYLQHLPTIREKGSHMVYIKVELFGYVVAPCNKIKLWCDGKTPGQLKEKTSWEEAGTQFKISKSPKLIAIKFQGFKTDRVTNRNMAFLAAFGGNVLSSRNNTGKWDWKCLPYAPVNNGWKTKLIYPTHQENWTTLLTQYANKPNNRKEFPFVKEIYEFDPKAKYVWVDKQGPEVERLYCRVIIT